MNVHPKVSDGTVTAGLPSETIIIGGRIREQDEEEPRAGATAR